MKIPNMYIAFENRLINVLGILLFLTVIIIYTLFFFRFSLNIPLGFDDCLIFLKSFEEDYFDKSNFFDRIFFLFRKQYGHFSFMARFLSVVSFHLFNEVNLRFILIVSNLAHIILCLLLLRTLDFNPRKSFFYLPVILLLFVPIGIYASWPIAASAFIFSALFSFGAFYFLVRERFVIAAVFALFATLSLENGIFVFVLGFAFLIKLRCEKNLSIMILLGWPVVMLICAYLVFMDGMKVSGSTNPLQMILEQPEILLYPFVFATSLVSRYFGSLVIPGVRN